MKSSACFLQRTEKTSLDREKSESKPQTPSSEMSLVFVGKQSVTDKTPKNVIPPFPFQFFKIPHMNLEVKPVWPELLRTTWSKAE